MLMLCVAGITVVVTGAAGWAGVAVRPADAAEAQLPPSGPPPAELDTEALRQGIEAVALLPEGTRELALRASLQPALVERIAIEHRKSAAIHDALLNTLPDEDRGSAWELLRRPALLESLARALRGDSASALAASLDGLSDALRSATFDMAVAHPAVVVELDTLRVRSEERLSALFANYPIGTQATFHTLIQNPRTCWAC